MEAKGVIFNYEGELVRPSSFTVTIMGDQEEYIHTIKSLLSLIRSVPQDSINSDTLVDVCDLIIDMLPSSEQINTQNPNNKSNILWK